MASEIGIAGMVAVDVLLGKLGTWSIEQRAHAFINALNLSKQSTCLWLDVNLFGHGL